MYKLNMKRENKLNKRGTIRKKAEIHLSFQFIFSVILIAVVLFVGFYVIKMFLNNAERVKLLDFVAQLRSTIIEISDNTEESSQIFTSSINKNIEKICFISPRSTCSAAICQDPLLPIYRTGNNNMFFFPLDVAPKYKVSSGQEMYCSEPGEPIKSCITLGANPTCIPVYDGQVKIRIVKYNATTMMLYPGYST